VYGNCPSKDFDDIQLNIIVTGNIVAAIRRQAIEVKNRYMHSLSNRKRWAINASKKQNYQPSINLRIVLIGFSQQTDRHTSAFWY
jgi:hypothetical protein